MSFFRSFATVIFGFILVIASNSVLAKTSKKELIDEVFGKYKSAKMVQLDVKKKVKSELLGKQQVFEGQIYLAQKLFRWDTETPDKSQIIFDGKNIWNVQYPPKEMKSSVNIAKMKLNASTKKQMVIGALLNQSGVTKNFKILKQKNTNGICEVSLEPKTNDMNIKNLTVKIDVKPKLLSMISYEDDLGNLTEIEILKTTFSKSAKAKLFQYQPPKGASVTNL